MTRFIHENVSFYQLPIVLIGRKHVGFHAFLTGFCSQCANDIISFKPLFLQDRNVKCVQDFLNDGHTLSDSFGRFFTLCLVGWVGFMAESLAQIECHAKVSGLLFGDNLVQGVDKS